jgi:(R,R)-butanediol dehydrogenase / meso-butanediol dehydrogenase / diacetyl reductase
MKALQLHGHRDIRLDDVPEPTARRGWSVVKVLRSSICHSDLREWEGPSYIGRTGVPNPLTGVHMPVILGHEFSAEIVEMNGSPEGFAVGDRVAPDGCIYDQTCYWCQIGRYNLCAQGAVLGFDGHGSHAQYVAVPNYSLYRIPDSMSDEHGALIEPLSVAVHGLRQGKLRLGDNVAVIGGGMIGTCVAMIARASGAAQVFVSEILEGRRARLAAAGFQVINPTDGDVGQQIRDRTGGIGADLALDCVGVQSSFDAALAVVRKAGRVVLVGLFTKDPVLNVGRIGLDEVELYGCLAYAHDFDAAIALAADGRIDLDGLVTGRIPLRDIVKEGFERFERDANEHLRIVVDTQAI